MYDMLVAAQSPEPNAIVLSLAVLCVLAAAAVLAVLWATTDPPRPEPSTPTMDLGDETPALVDLLTGDFEVDDDAVPATAVDLAARGWLAIEEVTGGNVILRTRAGKGELTLYEQRVLDHVSTKATDGVAPAEALTLGPRGVSERWWKGFVREVNRHGRDLGLCRRRWDFIHLAVIWAPIGLAWMLVMVTSATADRVETTGGWGDVSTLVMALSYLAMIVLTYGAKRITWSDAQAETDAGMDAASRWLGVRDHMRRTGSFENAPAASVTIWDRNLAYATAMGLAPVVQRELPFETEHDRQAWSRATGRWRRVKVRYLSARPAWGVAPWTAAITGAIQSAFLGVAAWVGLQFAREELDVSSLPDRAQEWLPVAGLAAFGMAAAALVFTLVKTALGLLDLLPRRTIEGEVVRRREYQSGHRLPKIVQWMRYSGRDQSGMQRSYRRRTRFHLAIDDGSDDRILAHQVRPQLFGSVRQGSRVRVKVTPLLGYVSQIEEISPPSRGPSAVAHELVEDVTDRGAAAATGLFDRLTEQIATMGQLTDEAGHPVLDQVDEDGRSGREKLAEAQAQLRRLSAKESLPSTKQSDGSPLLGGLLDDLSDALGGVASTETDPEAPGDPMS